MFDGLKRGKSKRSTSSRKIGGGKLRIGTIAHIFYRVVQIIMAIVVIGYYASDLNAARKVNKYSDSKWIFAVVVGSMAAISALILGVVGFISETRTVAMLFPWEWIMVILWSAVTGLFGTMYAKENPEMDSGVAEMKTAFYFDCVNLALWGLSAIVATAMFFFGGQRASLHTGRART